MLEGLIPGGGWTLLLGPGKVGKSLFGAQLAHALATGQEFFGCQNRAGPLRVVYVQADTPGSVWTEEVATLGLPSTPRVQFLFPDWGALSLGVQPMRDALEPYRPQYVIWDSMEKVFFGLDLTDKEIVAECLSRLRRLCGPAFGLIHHTRKSRPGEEDSSRDAAWGSSFLSHDWTQQVHFRGSTGPVEIIGRLIRDEVLLPGKDVVRSTTGAWIRRQRETYRLEEERGD